jgi:Na+/proline symporter
VTQHFTWLDALVLITYLAGVTTLGMYFGRKQRNAADYFVASHTIPWWALMLSIVATETSALTFISTPGLSYGSAPGTGNLGFLQIVAGYILGRIVVASVLLPRYFKGKMVTAYALLEQRFGIGARRFTSIVFMVTRGLADSVRVFATAIPIALIISPTVQNKAFVMPTAILILGALTVLYTYKGGMKAVVWTELLQASVYLLGALSALVILGHAVSGGWSSILSQATSAGKTTLIDTYVGLDRAHTIWAGLIGGAFLAMASHGTDQLIVQRLLSARNLRDGRRRLSAAASSSSFSSRSS